MSRQIGNRFYNAHENKMTNYRLLKYYSLLFFMVCKIYYTLLSHELFNILVSHFTVSLPCHAENNKYMVAKVIDGKIV